MSTPPELDFLYVCFGLIASVVALVTYLKGKSLRTGVSLYTLSAILFLAAVAGFGYRMLHKTPAVVATSAPPPAPAKTTPIASAPAVEAKNTPPALSPVHLRRHATSAGKPVSLNSAPNGFAVSGGTLNNPTVNNNYAPPTPEGPNNAQLAASARDIAERFRSHQADVDLRLKMETRDHFQIAHDGIPPNFFPAMAGFSRPMHPEALQLRSQILGRLPAQPDDDECRTFLDTGEVFPGKPLAGCAKYFDRLANLLSLK